METPIVVSWLLHMRGSGVEGLIILLGFILSFYFAGIFMPYIEFRETHKSSLSCLGTDHYFLFAGLPFLGLANNFFLKSNAFQTILFITFCYENNFFTTIFKKHYRHFFISYLKKKHFLCMHTHEKSHPNETNSS